MWNWVFENSIVVGVLALVAMLACHWLKNRPAWCHLIWLALLVLLVAPPLPLPRFGPETILRDRVRDWTAKIETWLPAAKAELRMKGEKPDAEAGNSAHKAKGSETDTLDTALLTKHKLSKSPATHATPEASATSAVVVGGAKKAAEGGALATNAGQDKPSESVARGEREALLADASRSSGSEVESSRGSVFGSLSPADWLGLLWLAGSLVALLRVALKLGVVRRLLSLSLEAPSGLLDEVQRAAARFGVQPPKVRLVEGLGSPFLWAFGTSPTLFWPAERGEPSLPRCSTGVLAHELAHVKRRDHWIAWFEVFVTALLWWNPLVWFVRGRMRFWAELSCDAWAVTATPGQRRAYAESLIDAAESLSGALVLGHAEPRNFERRLRMVLRERLSHRAQPLFVGSLLAAAFLMYPTTTAQDARPASVTVDRLASDVEEVVRVHDLWYEAKACREAEDAEGAIGCFEKIVKLKPKDGLAWNLLGYLLLPKKEYARARHAFEMQRESGFRVDIAEYNLACTAALQGDKAKALAQLERAVRYGFIDAKKISKDSDLESLHGNERFEALLDRAREIKQLSKDCERAFDKKKLGEAEELLSQLVELQPHEGEHWHHLAYVRIGVRKLEAAEKAIEKQIECGYKPVISAYNLACIRALQGKSEAAIEMLAKSVKLGFDRHKLIRTDPDLESLRGDERFAALRKKVLDRCRIREHARVAHELADWETAAPLFRKAIKSGQDDASTWSKLSSTLAELEDHDGARKAGIEALKRSKKAVDPLVHLAELEVRRGEVGAAKACLRRAVALGLKDRGRIEKSSVLAPLCKQGQLKPIFDAIADAEVLSMFKARSWQHLEKRASEATAKKPKNGRAWLQLGWAKLRTGQTRAALHAFEKQVECGHLPGIAHYNVACAHAQLGQADDAFAALDKSIEHGFVRPEHIAEDPDLDSLRGDARFAKFVERVKARYVDKKSRKSGKWNKKK